MFNIDNIHELNSCEFRSILNSKWNCQKLKVCNSFNWFNVKGPFLFIHATIKISS